MTIRRRRALAGERAADACIDEDGWVRLSEFWSRMERRLGSAYAVSYAADQVLPQLGGRTVTQALADGDDVKQVWRAVADATDAPAAER